MLTRNAQKDRDQIQMVTLDDLVPGTHLVRKLEMALDWNFIYDLVEPLYCEDNGRPSIDPVMLVKLAVINSEKSEINSETKEVIPKKSAKGKLNPNTSKKKRKHRKVSTVDPESGWFEKGDHKSVFAFLTQTACDRNGVVLGFSIHPGNENDGKTFPELLKELEWLPVEMIVGDTAYKTPAIAKLLKDMGIKLLSTYKRPQTKKGYFKKADYVYDEYYDCYICPNNEVLKYSTTDRDGLKEYKSDPKKCKNCPYLAQCTQSRNHQKVVTRHVWQEALEEAIENEYTPGLREVYKRRQETIERVFAMAKELHGFRYTQEYGRARQRVKAALTYACMNLKKLARKRWSDKWREHYRSLASLLAGPFSGIYRPLHRPIGWGRVCRQAEHPALPVVMTCALWSMPRGG